MGLENDDNLKEYLRLVRQKDKEHKEQMAEIERQRRIKQGLPADPQPQQPKHFDHPDTMENSTATILYVLVMIGGAIFTDRILIWIAATIIWLRFILRHEVKK